MAKLRAAESSKCLQITRIGIVFRVIIIDAGDSINKVRAGIGYSGAVYLIDNNLTYFPKFSVPVFDG